MGSVAISNREELLERGWYVVQDVETAFLGLSGKAHDLLIIIKHLQGENPTAFPTQKHLAKVKNWSVRTVQRILKELISKGALEVIRTGRANQHRVNYCLGTVAELRILLGGDIEIPHELVISDTTPVVASDTTDPDATPYIKNQLPRTTTTPSLREGGDADAPHVDRKAQMARNRQPQRDELDPAESLGLWNSQEADEVLPDGPEGLFPAEDVSPPLKSPRKRIRSQAQADAAGSLAFEFDALVRQQSWAGPAPVNKAALARNLSQWKRDGLTADQIRAMMQRYVDADFHRARGRAPWLDFIGQRHKLLTSINRVQANRAVEQNRYASEEHWLGTMAGGR